MNVKKTNWIPLFATQFFGVLNYNFLKYLIVFISAFWMKDEKALIISMASGMLVVPFILFSALAGKWAKIFSKRKIVIIAKLAEIPIMLIAVIGFYIQSIVFVMVSLFLMGLQSAIYSPSKYGLIKDVGGEENLSYGTGNMEMLTFLSVLLGTFFAGIIADLESNRFLILSIILIFLAIIGYFASLKIKANEPELEKNLKDNINPISFFFQSYKDAKKIKGVNYSVFSLAVFWFIGSIIQMNLIVHAEEIYDLNSTQTGLLMSIIAIGIGLGCWITAIVSGKKAETGLVIFGGIGLGISLFLISVFELSLTYFIIYLFFSALSGGFFKVPLNTYIQEKVKGRLLGQIIAYNNLLVFTFILLSAGAFFIIEKTLNTYWVFAFISFISFGITIFLIAKFPNIFQMALRLAMNFVTKFIFNLKIDGKENIPLKDGALLVSNHIGFLDAFLIVASMQRIPRFIIMKEMFFHKSLHWLLKHLLLVPVNEKGRKSNLMYFYESCQDEIKKGNIVVIFAESMMSRTGHTLGYKRGLERIAKETNSPIIPFYMDNAFGSPLTFITRTEKLQNFKFKNLRRKVSVKIGKAQENNSTAFQIRQKTLEMAADIFENRIGENENLISFIIKNKMKNKTSFIKEDKTKIYFDHLFRKSKKIAHFLRKKLIDEKNIAIYLPKGIYFIESNLILHFLDKKVFILNEKFSKEDLEFILDENKIKYIFTEESFYNLNKKRELIFLEGLDKSFEYAFISSKKKLFLNKKTDISTVIYKKEKKKNLIKIEFTNENILSSLLSLKQIAIFGKKDILFNSNNDVNNYLIDIWFPLFFKINVVFTKKNIFEKNKFIDFLEKEKISLLISNKKMIENYFSEIKEEKTIFLKHIVIDKRKLDENLENFIKKDLKIFITNSLDILECTTFAAIGTMNFTGKDVSGAKITQHSFRENKIGKALISNFIKIVDKNDFYKELKENENGMILIKGKNVIASYPENPKLNGERFFDDYFITKLIGNINPEGFIEII